MRSWLSFVQILSTLLSANERIDISLCVSKRSFARPTGRRRCFGVLSAG